MTDHGPQFDNFRAQSGFQHGGATFDEDFRAASASEAHGKLFDKFPKRPGVDRYGERWDDFPWKDVPSRHGGNYDEGFASRTAHSGDHGTWFDEFRGAAVRYMVEGADYEGVVEETHPDHMVVRSREGARHEVIPDQLLAYATGMGNPFAGDSPKAAETVDLASIGASSMPGPQGERPSGESHTAMGGGRHSLDVSAGQSKVANKTEDDDLDVTKTWPTVGAKGHYWHSMLGKSIPVTVHRTPDKRGYMHVKMPKEHGGEIRRVPAGVVSQHPPKVGKSVDSSETAAQKKDDGGSTGQKWCKTCKHYCRRTPGGKCPTCGNAVTDTTRKSFDAGLDVIKELAQ